MMNRGNSAPVLASVWEMKLAACCCAAGVQRGPLGALAFVVGRGAIGSPLGLLRRGSHNGLPVG